MDIFHVMRRHDQVKLAMGKRINNLGIVPRLLKGWRLLTPDESGMDCVVAQRGGAQIYPAVKPEITEAFLSSFGYPHTAGKPFGCGFEE